MFLIVLAICIPEKFRYDLMELIYPDVRFYPYKGCLNMNFAVKRMRQS